MQITGLNKNYNVAHQGITKVKYQGLYKEYPRFMKYMSSEDMICPDDESVELRALPENFLDSVIAFFKAFIGFVFKKK